MTREIDEQTGLGEAYMRSLLRTQLRLAARLCLALAAVVVGLPLVFSLFPAVAAQLVLGVPLPWLLLGGLIYPWFVGCGWWYVRQAERNEDDFAELVDRAPVSGNASISGDASGGVSGSGDASAGRP